MFYILCVWWNLVDMCRPNWLKSKHVLPTISVKPNSFLWWRSMASELMPAFRFISTTSVKGTTSALYQVVDYNQQLSVSFLSMATRRFYFISFTSHFCVLCNVKLPIYAECSVKFILTCSLTVSIWTIDHFWTRITTIDHFFILILSLVI